MNDTIGHDRTLFRALVDRIAATEPEIRTVAMFGCPAVFVGRRMAFCVYGNAIGAKLPADRVRSLIDTGQATPFRPYGKPPMREWLQLLPAPDQLDAVLPILTEAIAFARVNERPE